MTIHLLYFYANRGQENSMERWWFNSMVFKKELERKYGIKKSTDNLGPSENTSESEDPTRNGRAKNIHSSRGPDNSSYSNVDDLFGVKDILNFISENPLLVRDSNGDSYSIYFNIENHSFEIIDNNHFVLSEWNNYITSCINRYLQSKIGIDMSIEGDSSDIGGNSSDSYISRWIFDKRRTSSESGRSDKQNHAKSSDLTLREEFNDLDWDDLDWDDLDWDDLDSNDLESNDLDANDLNSNDLESNDLDSNDLESNDLESNDLDSNDLESNDLESNDLESNDLESNDLESNDLDAIPKHPNYNNLDAIPKNPNYKDLWVQCENEDCYALNYKRFLKSRMYTCEECGYHFKMNSSERIEVLLDPGTWEPMDEDLFSLDPIGFDSESDIGFDSESDIGFDSESDIRFDSESDIRFDLESDIRFDSESDIGFDSESYIRFDLESDIRFDSESDIGFDSESDIRFDSESDSDSENTLFTETTSYLDVIIDPEIGFYSEIGSDSESEEDVPYKDRIDSYQRTTGLTEAVQTGVGQVNGIPVAIGFMDFEFMGGSMGSVVGEKITRLIEYATNQLLPLIIVCASGGARMQEGSLSLMQMAKISSALYDYQSNKKLFYVSILTSPTTGGVTASFGMLGDIIIAEPDSYIAFAGKRVIEETLKQEVPEGSQVAELLFEKGLFDLIVPRKLLKDVLSELLQLHDFFPLNSNSIK
uniref:Acetyl-coenzyme A carboxylase carboxyl transferase subunit beta, chloroplastic n=1 Tax=Spathodea campanulata TaxID=211926 RepID=A0A6M8AUA5_SPACM|nr:acetyl-CoA carboxylase carboxyltransferase beta subunit [Spathodea campanulata]QKD76257.1 acetyl-CoA carboxylase carboxyltransferase beta subunit [Spathodea campanulata]